MSGRDAAGRPAGRSRPGAPLLALLVLGWAAACGGEEGRGPGEVVDGEGRRGGTAVVGGLGDIPSVNPLTSVDYVASQVERFVLFVPLVRLDEGLEPAPHLARSWEASDDSSQVTFRLRRDLRWHDGEPVTAADVAFTFRRVKDPDVPYPNRSYFSTWDSVEVLDDHTVRFRAEVTAGYLYGWTRLPVLPEHVLGDVPPARLADHPFGTTEPVGNGPFRFVEHRENDRWVFGANEDFPEELGGPPRLDRLVYRVVPDETTLLSELRAGEVHLVLDMPPSQLGRVRDDPGLEARIFTFPSYTFVVWNTRRPLFSDERVRRALALAVDRRQVVEATRGDLATPASGPVGPWHWAHDPAWRPLPHDPDSARSLLAAAGWTDRDGDGVRERAGEELRFELLVNQNRLRRDIAVMVQEQLAEVGAAVEPRVMEWASLGQRVTGPERDFDAFVMGITQDLVFDDRPFWACGEQRRPFDFAGYCSPALAAVLDSIPRASDRGRRRRLLRRYHGLVHRAQPYMFLFFERRMNGLRRSLEGVEADVRGDLVSVKEWWLRPEGR